MCRHLATALLLLAGIWQITRGQESLDGAGLAFWEDAWAAENANPDFQTVSCPDYRAVTAAINDFRAPYGQEPLQYSNDLEEAAKTRLAMEATTCEQSTQPLAPPTQRPHPPLHRHAQPIHACAPCLWGWAPSLGKPVQFEPQQSSRTLPQAASRCLPPAMGFCRRCRG